MSSKSNQLNLYDSVDGSKHYFQKVSSDKIDIECDSLPMNFKSSSVSFHNLVGQQVTDIVGTVIGQGNAIAQEATDRAAAVSAEASARTSADSTLQSNIDAEATARASAVSAEASARSSADVTLQNNIDAEVAARQGAVTAELNARSAADSTLQFNIDAEASARATADNSLQSSITQEVSDRQAAISSLTTSSNAAVTLVQSNLDAEIANRIDDDDTLQSNINAEVAARSAAVSAEASARASADTTLSSAISAETTARLAEVAVERSRIDTLLEGTGVDLDQLKELIAAYNSADTGLQDQITNNLTQVNAVQLQLTALQAVVDTLVTVTDPEVYTQMYTATVGSLPNTLVLTDMDGNLLNTKEQYNALLGYTVKIDGVETQFHTAWESQIFTVHADWSGYDVSAVYVKQPPPSFEQRYVITSITDDRAFLADLD